MRRRSRFTIRSLIVFTAVVGLTIGGEQMRCRRVYCLRWASAHAEEEQYHRECIEHPFLGLCGFGLPRDPQEREQFVREHRERYLQGQARDSEYHSRLKREFARAAWRPWESVPIEPFDPPDP